MTLADTMNGPIWVLYVVTGIFAIMSITLLSGHGSCLIAGYNTASKEEKAKYDEKKLCLIFGIGLGAIAILLAASGIFCKQLPASFAYFLAFFIVLDTVIMIVTSNIYGKR